MRLKLNDKIYKILSEVQLKNNEFLYEKFENIIIGKGSFGTVYKLNNFNIASKKTKITALEYKNLNTKKIYPFELLCNLLVNYILELEINPHFVYTYKYNTVDISKKFLEVQTELLDGSLDIFMKTEKNLNNEILYSILFQVLSALFTIHHVFGLFHNDIKLMNFLFKRIPSGGFWKYTIRKKEFYVPNCGIQIYLNDYGVGRIFRKQYHQNKSSDFGIRRLKIENNIGIPFFTKYIYINNKKEISPRNISSSLGQKFTYKVDLEPDISIDLEDFDKFPPEEFALDVIDSLHMFTGGKRKSQEGNHEKILPDSKFLKHLDDIVCDIPKYVVMNKTKKLYLYNAFETLKVIFKNRFCDPQNFIEEFKL